MAGIYTDDLHLNCTRKIDITGKNSFVITGTDAKGDAVGGRGDCNHINDFAWTIHGTFQTNSDGKLTIEADFTEKDKYQTPSNATNYDPDTRKRLRGVFDSRGKTIQWLVDGNHWRKIQDRSTIEHNVNNQCIAQGIVDKKLIIVMYLRTFINISSFSVFFYL